ncbi:hypothetical protein ANO14919_098740 [Xylariales sp. No.14919]|nr:hypothetical protein ANO14919_098740 [Xylariales sp. No.14919]
MTTQRTSQAPRQATVSLADIRQTYSQTRLRFTKTRGVQRITREGGIEPDFITLICLVSEIYRSYGDELEPVRQFHPSRETPYSQGHTSSVSHTKISRHITIAVSRDDATTTISEGIIIKRPRKSILEQDTYALVSFITELRVRTHAPLKEHPNIAQLRGVGWDFEDEEATIPRPLLLEELAPQGSLDNFWARWNFVRLKFKSKLDLARNIAEGIRAMHDCGIVHGDIKPENILIFPRKDADNEFVAKLTDFGHSVFEYSHSQSLPAFTPQWCAPELLLDESGPNPMGFREMKLTDTYSYGLVVLSIMIGRPFHESVVDFMTPKSNGTMLKDAIELVSKEDRENNDSDLDLATIELLMRRTIQLRPKHRSLNQCIKIMNHYDKINGHKVRISAPDRAGREDIIKGLDLIEMVAVGHSTFSRTSHQLKAHIVESLLRIANDTKDPRNLAIAWELSVCYFSGFGVEISFQSASKWLLVASEAGIPAARYYVAILHEAMNIPYQVLPRQYKEHRIAMPVSEHQSKVQVTGPGSEDLGLNSSQESDYESDTEYLSKPSTHASTSKKMPTELLDIFNLGTLRDLQAYLQDKPEDINSRDFEGNTPLILAARQQKMDMLKLLLEQVDIDAGIPNHSGHTVLHFLPSFDDETVKDLVPKLAQRRADIQHEARVMPLRSEDDVLIPEIRCCSILNAILHGNLTLLECLLEAAHAQGASSQCHVCECASRFRRVLAVSLSIFQARALTMLVGHVRDRGNRQDIGLKDIRVWASSKLLPLHKVPFNSVAIRALDLPDSVFRAMNYGTHYVEALEETIGFLLSTEEENVEDLAYSMITEAVESNTWEAVRFLLDEGENRQFTKSWWIRGPLDDSPFMRSISLGFREIFKLFMNRDTTLLQRRLVVTCWLPGCLHKRKTWDRYTRKLLGYSESVYYLPGGERKHDFNPAQLALWLSIDSDHQDYFFTNAILDAADPESITSTENILILEPYMGKLEELKHTVAQDLNDSGKTSFSDLLTRRLLRDGKRLDGSDFLEHAILSSVFSPASAIISRFPGVFRTRSLWPYPSFWRSSRKSNIRDTSRVSIRQVLRHGSYRQCRFIMERLLPLRTRSTSRTIEHRSLFREKYNSPEEGVQKWTRCPLSHEEYHQLVTGNIRTHGSARKDLWNVIETQAKLGHSRSASYLRQAIWYGNHEALEEMLERGWDPNGPLWARLYTPLQYTERLGFRAFNEVFRASDPDLPQTDWIDSRTHKAIYQAYSGWYNNHARSEWDIRLEKSQVILRKHGGKILPVTAIFTILNRAPREWSFIGFFLIYTIALPLTFTYATEGTWTSTSRGQKLGFSYLWSVLCICLPTFLLWRNRRNIRRKGTWLGDWIPVGLLIVTNYVLLPILVIRVNWRPFLSCHDTITDYGSGTTCNVVTKCTDYSYLLPLAVVAIELVVWAVLESKRIMRL